MFRLILLLILFLLFTINYYFSYFQTIPTFNHISHFNFYTYLQDKFENRNGSFTGLDITEVTVGNKKYLIDYTGGILKTDLKYLGPKSDKLDIYIPIFILHTGNTLQRSGDNLFTGLKRDKSFLGYDQYITGGNDFIDIGNSIKDGKSIKQTLYLGYFYIYCSMSQTGRIDAYYFDRYKDWNKNRNTQNENKINGSYVCEDNRDKTQNITDYFGNTITVTICSCSNKGEYWICKDENNGSCNTGATATDGACIDYYTGTINLNNTNCSLSGALGIGSNKKYFLIR